MWSQHIRRRRVVLVSTHQEGTGRPRCPQRRTSRGETRLPFVLEAEQRCNRSRHQPLRWGDALRELAPTAGTQYQPVSVLAGWGRQITALRGRLSDRSPRPNKERKMRRNYPSSSEGGDGENDDLPHVSKIILRTMNDDRDGEKLSEIFIRGEFYVRFKVKKFKNKK